MGVEAIQEGSAVGENQRSNPRGEAVAVKIMSAEEAPEKSRRQSKLNFRSLARGGEMLFATGLAALFVITFFVGRVYWSERYYTPEEGLGYTLGLVGGILMLLACCYTLVKRVRWLRLSKFMRHWLRIHIVLGIVGPFLVLMHSGFHIGSINGGVALISMTLVFASGLIGRYLYSRIYFGLNGKRAQSQELREMLLFHGKRVRSKRIESFQASVLGEPADLIHALYKLVKYKVRSLILKYTLLRDTRRRMYAMGKKKGLSKAEVKKTYKEFKANLKGYMQALRKAALFGVYERFFDFWRHAHVPLLYLLLISGIVHVIAVHMY